MEQTLQPLLKLQSSSGLIKHNLSWNFFYFTQEIMAGVFTSVSILHIQWNTSEVHQGSFSVRCSLAKSMDVPNWSMGSPWRWVMTLTPPLTEKKWSFSTLITSSPLMLFIMVKLMATFHMKILMCNWRFIVFPQRSTHVLKSTLHSSNIHTLSQNIKQAPRPSLSLSELVRKQGKPVSIATFFNNFSTFNYSWTSIRE